MEVAPETIRSIREVRNLSAAEAQSGRRADVEGVVMVFDLVDGNPPNQVFFLHDAEEGIYVNFHGPPLNLHSGEKVRVAGPIGPGLFAPEFLDPVITPMGSGALPPPLCPSYEELASGRDDCQYVEVQGIVRDVGMNAHRLSIQLGIGGARLAVSVAEEPQVTQKAIKLVDARVRVCGAVRTFFNGQRQMIDVGLYCAGFDSIEILEPAAAEAQMPVTPVKDLLTYARDAHPGHRVKVQGVVTYQEPGSLLFIKDDTRGLMVKTAAQELLSPGDRVEVLGFPMFGISTPMMEDGVCRRLGSGTPLRPISITANEQNPAKLEADLVSLKARLLEDTCQGHQRVLWMQAGSTLFQAMQPLGDPANFRPLRSESEVIVTGIYLAHGPLQYLRDTGWMASSFQILVPSSGEVRVLHLPPWWTTPRIMALLGIVAACFIATAGWVLSLRRRVRQQTELIRHQVQEQAVLQERNRIAREFHDTFAQGFAATAFQLEALGDELAGASDKARSYFTMALTMVRHSLAEARRAVAGLRAETLGTRDLPHALRAAGDLIVANSKVVFEFNHSGAVRTLPPARESNLLRIAQEAVTNAMRHAHPHRIAMELRYETDSIRLRVSDDGSGFVPGAVRDQSGHFGLRGMEERARQIGAELRVESSAGSGTTVTIVLGASGVSPLPEAALASVNEGRDILS